MTSLKMATHGVTGRRMVEVYDDEGQMVGAIYATQDGSNRIHIVSQHFDDTPIEPSEGLIDIPGYTVQFKRRR